MELPGSERSTVIKLGEKKSRIFILGNFEGNSETSSVVVVGMSLLENIVIPCDMVVVVIHVPHSVI